ncbi:hypothetical protein Cch01nite_00340 [Cellulomonas chitinilytica]|uniref:Uncharacterized protein n=1 Tax=Cellulomonas chitinilytica TaxID=398759 RepID=A0A919TXD9_9CELL|nr:hypothetical protein [Cellulomonas chitinilytica]GIG19310.1 hypothetical protein Cch01nite_00340 [Cellulomonas chitinilytica]
MDMTTTYTSSVERAVSLRNLVPTTSVFQGRALPIPGSCATHGVTSEMKQITAKQPAFAPGNTTLGGAVAWRKRGADLRLRPRTLMV